MSATRPLSVVPDAAPLAPKLSVRGVSKSYVSTRGERIQALDDIGFDVAPGEFVCLIGPSGCGKSTLLNLVAGLERPDGGEIWINDRPVTQPGPDRSVLFQEPSLFPWMTVLGNVEFALQLVGVPKEERAERAMTWLRKVHLTALRTRNPMSSPAGCANGPPSPERWRLGRTCCSAMSRSVRSMPSLARSCSRSSSRCGPRPATPSCS